MNWLARKTGWLLLQIEGIIELIGDFFVLIGFFFLMAILSPVFWMAVLAITLIVKL